MITWLRNKLAAPLLPILIQTHKVSLLIEVTLATILKMVVDGGVAIDTPIYNNIAKVLTAVQTINEALNKTIEFLGGTPITAQSLASQPQDLDAELEKLKNLI